MRFLHSVVLLMAGLTSMQAMAWENHSLASYRAFEAMPEVTAAAATTAEPLEAFLRAEENTLEALLASQEAWALANTESYPPRPGGLAFKADPGQSDETRRLAFLRALRVAPDSKFALYVQIDPWNPVQGQPLAANAVGTLAESSHPASQYVALRPGDLVAALNVLASATEEPDLGMDTNLFEDNRSEWGKVYGFGPQPFGNPLVPQASQAPFHTGFMHESRMVLLGMPALRRSLVLLRSHQYSTLASLSFRTGHAYWGWRFAGLSLHYLQEMTQPYRVALAPGESGLRLIGAQALALSGMPGMKNDLLRLKTNRRQVLEKYLCELLQRAASSKQETALEKALHNLDKDKAYPDWNDHYLRDVVSLQANRAAPALAQTLVTTMPSTYVSDPSFDFSAHEAQINLVKELGKRDTPERARLDSTLAELMGNFGAHSRNALRGILRASDPL